MSRARHEMMEHEGRHKRADGGKIEPEVHDQNYNGAENNVEKEAMEKKKGGRIKRKDGGRTMEHHAEGKHMKPRMDRPARRAKGGAVGSDSHPLSTAARITNAQGHDADAGNAEDGP